MRARSLLPFAGLLLARATAQAAGDPTPEQIQFFESKVRPILTEKCYKCHSIEQGKSKGGLTLDTKDGLLKGGETGPGVKPGSAEASLLIKAVLYTDSDLQMPPKGEKLSDAQIADLTSWVKMGAPDPRTKAKGSKLSGLTDSAKKHWAFQPVKKPEIPAVKNRAWCVTPVDAFIMEKLEEKGLAASPDADRDTLLRRATYDLIGLPPTVEEIEAFRNDPLPTVQALAKVIDRLQESPHYGERWGRYWLDSARYADTTGERGERGEDYRYPYAWTYRDWVINAINSDLPYDQFIVQQLAADKIQNNPQENLAALGFLSVGEKFKNQNDIIDDQINVTSKGFLGLTVTCARCHDHMFDPIPTKDYYALHGVFASTMVPAEEPVLKSAIDPAAKADYDKKVAAAEQANRDKFYGLIKEQSGYFREKAGAYLQAGYSRRTGAPQAEQQAGQKVIQDAKLEVPLLNEMRRYLRPNNEIFGPYVVCAEAGANLQKAAADIAANAGNRYHPMVAAAFKGVQLKSMADVTALYTKFFASLTPTASTLLRNYAAAKSNDSTGLDDSAAKVALAPFHILPARELDTDTLRKEVQKFPIQLQGRGRFDFSSVNYLTLTSAGAAVRVMAVMDVPNPHDSPVFQRGQAGVPGAIEPRHFLEILSGGHPAPFKEGSGRLELAKDIANKNNPLTARVMVNRVWMHHFGQGFVRTPDDLGTRSETPSHQELLDYLSWYFMENGWSIKKLNKLIMLSKVYSESSHTIKTQEDVDPDNRYLWRANVRRLDFEAFRDSLLVMSGRLDPTLGGQPVNVTDEPYTYRRSVYGYVDRGNLPELMQNFDFSNPDMPNSARTSTIVPQQALFLMNSPMAIDVARQIIAQPEVADTPAGGDFIKVQKMYEIVFGRMPTKSEIEMGIHFVTGENYKQKETEKAMKDVVAKAESSAQKLVTDREKKIDATKSIENKGNIIERKPLTPWETYAQALLFSNEASYVN